MADQDQRRGHGTNHRAGGAYATACRQAPARIRILHTWRTKNGAGRAWRVTVSQAAAKLHRITYSCTWHVTIGLKSSGKLNGRAWVDNCDGASLCYQTAASRKRDITTGSGWTGTIKTGSSTEGCTDANYAWVNLDCVSDPDVWGYETIGIFTVYRVNGSITGPIDKYSPIYTLSELCY